MKWKVEDGERCCVWMVSRRTERDLLLLLPPILCHVEVKVSFSYLHIMCYFKFRRLSDIF
jgi:hypothetical protein